MVLFPVPGQRGDPGTVADFVLVQLGNMARKVGYGDFATGWYMGRAFTVSGLIYQFDTPDDSGSTTVELHRNGVLVAGSQLVVSAENQVDGMETDEFRTAEFSQTFTVGDRAALYIASLGNGPGKGLRAWVFGLWN